MRTSRLVTWALVLALVSLWSADVRAGEPVQAARELAREGLALFESGRFDAAHDKFAEANRLRRAPTLLLYMARCRRELGRLLEAQSLYQMVLDEPVAPDASEPFRQAQSSAEGELGELRERIPSIRIAVRGSPASETEVGLDGKLVEASAREQPIALDPGRHVLSAWARGYRLVSREIELAADGSVTTVELALEPEPPTDGAGQAQGPLWPSLVVLGVGAAALGVGTATGMMSLSKTTEIQSHCNHNICGDEHEQEWESASTLADVSTWSFVGGGAAVAAGVVLLIVRPGGSSDDDDKTVRLEPWLGPGLAGLQGRF